MLHIPEKIFQEDIFYESIVIKDTPEKKQYSIYEILNKVICGNTLQVLDKIDPNSFDMVFIDPPYKKLARLLEDNLKKFW